MKYFAARFEAFDCRIAAFNAHVHNLAVDAAEREDEIERLRTEIMEEARALGLKQREVKPLLATLTFDYRASTGEPASPAEPPFEIPAVPASEMTVAPGGKVLIVKSDVEGDPLAIPGFLRKAPPTREDTQS